MCCFTAAGWNKIWSRVFFVHSSSVTAVRRFFDHTHSLQAVKKMKTLAVARLPDSEGLRKETLGGSLAGVGGDGSSSFMVIAIIAVLALLGAYYVMTQQE